MKKHMYLFFSFFLSIITIGQDKEAFEKIYTKTYLETAQTNMQSALKTADSLVSTSTDPFYKMKSLMLVASLYQQDERLADAIRYAEKSMVIANQINNTSWKVRITGFLATQYRLLGIYTKSKDYAKQALALTDNIEDVKEKNVSKGLIHQEMAYFEENLQKYNEAIKYLQQSQMYFDKIELHRDFFTINNEQLLAKSYYHLHDYKNAQIHYHKGIAIAASIPPNYMKGLLYCGMGNVFLANNKMDSARIYLTTAEEIEKASPYLQLKYEILLATQQYYLKANNIKKSAETNRQLQAVLEEINKKKNGSLDQTYTKMDRKSQAALSRNGYTHFIILILLIAGIAGIIYFMYVRKKQKLQLKKFYSIIENMQTDNTLKQPVVTPSKLTVAPGTDKDTLPVLELESDDAELKEKDGILMSPAAEKKILSGLIQFEKSRLYLNNSISLSYLATHLHTNTKYLSHVINLHRKKDFNNYINELRVQYAIEKLKEDPEWRQYKISVLAKEAGFSSHSKFATIFKSFTGLTPSIFIQYLNKKQFA